jgi:hypothetical protein
MPSDQNLAGGIDSTEPERRCCSAPLSGEWRHAEGFLICGTLRIARVDFDTDPSEGFRVRMFDWICDTLNAAQND